MFYPEAVFSKTSSSNQKVISNGHFPTRENSRQKVTYDDYIYVRSRKDKKKKSLLGFSAGRSKQCRARAITNDPPESRPVVFFNGHCESQRKHSNQEECAAEEITVRVKRKAVDNPEKPLTQLLPAELQGVA